MRKTLGIALTLALIVPGPASAELFNNLKLSGSLDIQNTSGRNILDFQTGKESGGGGALSGNDRISSTLTRILVDLNWDLLDDVHATVTFNKNNRVWGTGGETVGNVEGTAICIDNNADGDCQDVGEGNTPGVAGTTGALGLLGIVQSHITIDKMMGIFDVKLGRQFYGEPGDLVWYAGPKDAIGLPVTTMDAFRVDAESDMMTFTGIFATGVNTGGVAAATANTQIKGVELGVKNMPLKANVFVWNRTTQGAGALGTAPNHAGVASGLNDQLWVFGVKLRGEAQGGWISLDLVKNMGTDRLTGGVCGATFCTPASSRYTGYGGLLDVGYNAEIPDLGGFTPWGTFGYGSGRSSLREARNETFTMIASDFRPGVMNRKFSGAGSGALGSGYKNSTVANVGTNGLGNRVVWGLGANFTPAFEDRFTVGLAFWDFRFQRITDAGTATEPISSGNKHIGSEGSLTAEWRHSENVTLGLGYANFQPGGFIREEMEDTTDAGAGVNPAHMWYADFTIKF